MSVWFWQSVKGRVPRNAGGGEDRLGRAVFFGYLNVESSSCTLFGCDVVSGKSIDTQILVCQVLSTRQLVPLTFA